MLTKVDYVAGYVAGFEAEIGDGHNAEEKKKC